MVLGKDLKLLIFDFDGTIHDLEVDWAKAKTVAGVRPGESLGEAIDRHKLENNPEPLAALSRLEAEALAEQKLSPEIGQTLSELGQKYKLAIFSRNSSQAIADFLARNKVSADFIVGRDEVTRIKPDPEGLNLILEHFQVSPNQAVLVGDTSHDTEVAAAAGVACVIVGNNFRGSGESHFNLSSLPELPGFLSSL